MLLACMSRLNWNGRSPIKTAAMTMLSKQQQHLDAFRANRLSISTTPNGTVTASNPTLGWKGVTHSTSPHVRHVLVENECGVDTIKAIDESLKSSETSLSATELLELGSIWYLPAAASKDPSLGQKPVRLSTVSPKIPFPEILADGDYLRIHADPRRYLEVHRHDWNVSTSPLIVGRGNGWLVINKPPNVPVHPTVDNQNENVASCLLQANTDEFDYISMPQRLDQNTSGLLVVATSKAFAGYFAQLLRYKTQAVLNSTSAPVATSENNHRTALHKRYRCWVRRSSNQKDFSSSCVLQPNQILRHYLEPSISAPKRFLETPPQNTTADWLECVLRIVSVRKIETDLSWELDIELLTGRTHQIRGQLAAVGLPIVGDVMYNGTTTGHRNSQQKLALQCQALEFIDPDWNSTSISPSWRLSERWNCFSLPEPPWRKAAALRKCLPRQVDLAHGRHKYVLIHAEGPDSPGWFVKSASAEDCGGSHHGEFIAT